MNRILNFGSLNIDMVYAVDHFVRPGETLAAKSVEFFPGGKGLNQSVALKLAGGEVYHAGKIGNDGLWLTELLEKHGVNTGFVDRSGKHTGTAFIQVDSSGQNCIIINHGANGEITKEWIDHTLSCFSEGDLLVLQNEINLLEYIIDSAYRRRMVIAMNPSPIDAELLNMDFSKITYFMLNEIEGKALTGEKDPEAICKALLSRFPKAKIVLTLGEMGVVYSDAENSFSHGIYKVPVVDTTAAGDTFVGYFLSSVVGGADVKEALELASAASSIAVSRMGAASSIPTLAETRAALLKYKSEGVDV